VCSILNSNEKSIEDKKIIINIIKEVNEIKLKLEKELISV
jgi:hypothetical protein